MQTAQADLSTSSKVALEVVSVLSPMATESIDFQLHSEDECVGQLTLDVHKDGITSALAEFNFHDEVELQLKLRKEAKTDTDLDIMVAFPTLGRASIKPNKTSEPLAVQAGQIAVWQNRRGQAVIANYHHKEKVRFLALRIPPSLLYQYFGDELGVEPVCTTNNFTAPTTPAIQMAVHQYMRAPFYGSMRKLFLESKVTELIALSIDMLRNIHEINHQPAYSKMKSLASKEVECIHAARDELVANIESPPSLLDLAHSVGINQQKLKFGFRQVFGTTTFGYLQQHRLEQARQLLEEGSSPVSEVALAVGYTHFGHFASIFRKQFGVTPGNVRRGTTRPKALVSIH